MERIAAILTEGTVSSNVPKIPDRKFDFPDRKFDFLTGLAPDRKFDFLTGLA